MTATIITEIENNQSQTVNVVGYQWNWAFNYTDEDVYEVGSPSDLPTLYLPVGEKVQFVLTSPDVIHSFWIPDFLMKMDVIPGRANTLRGHTDGRGHGSPASAPSCVAPTTRRCCSGSRS